MLTSRTSRRFLAIAITAAALLAALVLVDESAMLRILSRLSLPTIAIVLLLLICGALLASARLACVAADLGYKMRPVDAIAALSFGQLAGAMFFQLAGQLVARSAYFTRRGVPVAGTIALTGYERLLALGVSLTLAVVGGWYLFGSIGIDVDAGGATFLRLAVGFALALLASAGFAWGRAALDFLRANLGRNSVHRIARGLLLSLAIQACTMAAYVTASVQLSPGIPMASVAAAAAIVMLAAAIPVSLAGWGVRELSAIYALGAIGMDSEAAVAVAILVGAGALVAVALLAAASALAKARSEPAVPAQMPPVDMSLAMAWAVPIAATVAVFFQLHVPLAQSRLNVNLADPIAVVAAALFIIECIKARRLPVWRLPRLNLHLAIMSIVILAAFLHGVAQYGVTPWALTNRLAGWFVLLAYMATGALLVVHAGDRGFAMMQRTFIGVALTIAVMDILLFGLVRIGVTLPREIVFYRVEGFAQNPNAFALQLLFAVAAIIVTFHSPRTQTVLLGLALTALWFTGSRSGLIALGLLLVAALALRAVKPSRLAGAFLIAGCAVFVMEWLAEIINAALYAWYAAHVAVAKLLEVDLPTAVVLRPPVYSPLEIIASGYDSSNVQRIASLQGGLQMFLEHPILGAGLGAFMDAYAKAHGVPLVIHSTPLWLAAEMGIVGLVAFAAPVLRLFSYEIRQAAPHDPVRTFTVLALLGFVAIAAVHDVLFQRPFWLLLGAASAMVRPGGAVEPPPRQGT